MSATLAMDGEMTIIHAAAMVCMALAMKYRPLVHHRPRKAGWRSVRQMDGWAAAWRSVIGGGRW